jgi:hypothetical protein
VVVRIVVGGDSMDDGATPDRVAEAADATASAYTQDAGLDIRKRLVDELERRGVSHHDAAWVDEIVDAVRAGHSREVTADPRRQFPTS